MRKVFYKILRESVIKSSFGSCGKNVHIAEKSDIKGIGNISIGDDVTIGPHALLWTTRANIIIKEKVIIGPRLSIITGDHKMNAVGKYMADVTDEEKEKLREMVSPNGAAMFVTPREIDLLIQRGARMIGMAINAALNPCFTVNDFELLTK